MKARTNEKTGHIRFSEHNITLVAKMLDKLSSTIDIMYFLMERREERGFVAMLISAKGIDDMEGLIRQQKRETDILFEIDPDNNLYALVCQDTKIDGGYHFAERLMKKSMEEGGSEVYCTELEVRSTSYKIRYIIYRLMELFIETKEKEQAGEVVFKALN